MTSTITQRQLLQYSILALPLAFAGLPVYLLAPDFYATSYHIPLTMLGASLLLLRFLDAAIDPLLGYLIDKGVAPFHTLMRLGALLMGIGILLLFLVPNLSEVALLAWFIAAVFITTLAYSLLTIGYGVQGAVWSAIGVEQVRITTTREGFTLIGLILAITLPSLLSLSMTTIEAHRALAVILVICLILAFAIYSGLTTPQPKKAASSRSRQTIRALFTPVLLKLYWIYGISVVASAIPAVLVIFFVRDYLHSYSLIGVYLLLYFLGGAAAIPIWRQLASKHGKLQSWMISMVVAICGFVLVLLCQPGDSLFYAGICLITGIALGAELALPPAILAELIEGEPGSVGLKYASLTGLNKLSLALAAGISLPLLGMLGFEPGQANDPDALSALLWIYGALPCFLKLCALCGAYIWKSHFYRETYA